MSFSIWALKVARSSAKTKAAWTWSAWRVCSWSTWQPWTAGLSWASRCVRCRSSRPNTGRCRNHLCWRTERGGCTGETRLNIHPYLWSSREGDLVSDVRFAVISGRYAKAASQWSVRRWTCSRDNSAVLITRMETKKQLVGEPQLSGWATTAHQINMVSGFLRCQSASSHDPRLCQLTQMRRTCGDVLWSV